MESIYTELALYDSKNECSRTDTVFLPISEICDGTVSLVLKSKHKQVQLKIPSMDFLWDKFFKLFKIIKKTP